MKIPIFVINKLKELLTNDWLACH